MTREEPMNQKGSSRFLKHIVKMPKAKLPNPINKITKFLKQRTKVNTINEIFIMFVFFFLNVRKKHLLINNYELNCDNLKIVF